MGCMNRFRISSMFCQVLPGNFLELIQVATSRGEARRSSKTFFGEILNVSNKEILRGFMKSRSTSVVQDPDARHNIFRVVPLGVRSSGNLQETRHCMERSKRAEVRLMQLHSLKTLDVGYKTKHRPVVRVDMMGDELRKLSLGSAARAHTHESSRCFHSLEGGSDIGLENICTPSAGNCPAVTSFKLCHEGGQTSERRFAMKNDTQAAMEHITPYTPHPTPHTPHPTPHTPQPSTQTSDPAPHTPHPTRCALHPPPHTPHPTPHTQHPTPNTQHPTP